MTTTTPDVVSGPVGPAAASCRPTVALDAGLDSERLAAISSALAEPLRVSILDVLRRHGEQLCQCELRALFEVAQPTLSHHLGRLVDAGLVSVERRHRWAFYAASEDALGDLRVWLGEPS